MTSVSDPGMLLAAKPGDVTGDSRITPQDASQVLTLVVHAYGGFSAYSAIDPVLIADMSGNGRVSVFDAAMVAKKWLGLESASAPAAALSFTDSPTMGDGKHCQSSPENHRQTSESEGPIHDP